MNDTLYFDFEKLDAYRHARTVLTFVASRRDRLKGLPGKSGEQLERAMAGALTNLGSGASAVGAESKRHFRIALTEAAECGIALELALAYGAFSPGEYAEIRQTLLRLCACLRGLSR